MFLRILQQKADGSSRAVIILNTFDGGRLTLTERSPNAPPFFDQCHNV